jgi:hypothetical protein
MSHEDDVKRAAIAYIMSASHFDIPSLRCSFREAASICDAIEKDIVEKYTKSGHLTKQGKELSAVVRYTANSVYEMVAKVNRRSTP